MERAIPILPADDLSLAKGFYVGKLGFEVSYEVTEDGKTGLGLHGPIHFREASVDDVPGLENARRGDSEAGQADPRMARYLRGEHHPKKALAPRVMYLAANADGVGIRPPRRCYFP